MSDLATIGLQYNPAGGKAAQAGLQAIIPPAVEAQKAVDKTGSSFDRLDAAADKFAAAAAGLSTATTALTAALDKQASAASSASVANDKNATSLDRAAVGATTLGAQVTALNVSYGQSFTAAVGLNKQLNTQSTAAAAAGSSMQQLDAHVLAFRNILELTTVATEGASKSIVQLDAHIEAYKTHLAGLNGAANSAKIGIDKVTKAANDNSGAMRANTGNIAAQFQDIGVTAAMGMNPLLIALQQGTQLSAVFAQSGASMGATLAAAFRSIVSPMALVTIGIVALSAYLIQLGVDFFSTGKKADGLTNALEKTKFATNGFKDAQGILSGIMDITTGKITTQSKALIGLARAQALAAQIQAKARAAEARSELSKGKNDFGGSLAQATGGGRTATSFNQAVAGQGTPTQRTPTGQIASQVLSGMLDTDTAIKKLDQLTKAGKITEQQFLETAAVVANLGVEQKNIETFDNLEDAINGDKTAIEGFLDRAKPLKAKVDQAAKAFGELTGDIARQTEELKKQAEGLSMSEDEALRLTNRTKILNDAQDAGVKMTDAHRAALVRLADGLTDAQIALRKATSMKGANDDFDAQMRAYEQGTAQIGVYGKELSELTIYQGLLNKATNNGKDAIDDYADAQLRGKAATLAGKVSASENAKFFEGLATSADQANSALERQRGEIGLTGAELIAYQHETDILADAQRQHITLTDTQTAAIHESSEAFGQGAQQVENMRTRLAALNDLAGSGPLGKLFGVLTSSDPTSALLGMGGIGSLIGLGTTGGAEQYKQQGEIIAKRIKDTFPALGEELSGKIADALQGASTGAFAAQTVFGGGTGTGVGGAIGGALGQQAGKMLAPVISKAIGGGFGKLLGGAAGPLGAIVGGLLGGALGSLLKKTKKGSATFDDDGLTGSSGNSASRISAAKSAGNKVLDVFADVLDQLGATATGVKFSTGMRDKNFTLDPTGGGRTKGAGVLNFGKDEAAFLEATLQEIFKDASFSGVSEGITSLLKSGGDVQKQLEKALTLQGAFDDLSQRKDPQAFDLSKLDKEFANLRSIATEAGEGLAQVEELYGLKRAEIVAKYAEDASEKEQAALDLAKDKRQLEIQIMDLSGDKLGALAAAREIERAGVDESLRPLYDRIYALQDEATAAAETARITDQRAGLEQRLLELSGDTVAIRAAELATLDASNRYLQERIYALEDEATATQAAAEALAKSSALALDKRNLEIDIMDITGNATAALAARRDLERAAIDASLLSLLNSKYAFEDQAAATQLASDALAKATALASTNRDLEIREMDLLGNTTGALSARRQIELTAADATTAVILRRIYALEDEATAADAAAKAADDLAAKTKAIADERLGLENQWLQLIGNTAEIRKRELAALDPSNRQLQQNIYDYQDALDAAAAAQEAATKAEEGRNAAIADARDVLSEAYNRERDELQSTIDALKDFSDGVKEFRLGLYADTGTPGSGYGEARNKFLATSSAARGGDATAMANFTSDAQAFLELARGQAASLADYQLDVGTVAAEALRAENGAAGQIGAAQRQQASLDAAVQGLFGVNEKLVSFKVALDGYNAAQAATVPVITQSFANSSAAVAAAIQAQGAQQDATQAENTQVMMTMLVALNVMARFTQRIDAGDSARVSAAETLPVSVIGTVATDEVA